MMDSKVGKWSGTRRRQVSLLPFLAQSSHTLSPECMRPGLSFCCAAQEPVCPACLPSSSYTWNPIDPIVPPGPYSSSREGKSLCPRSLTQPFYLLILIVGNSEGLSGVLGMGDQRALGWSWQESPRLATKLCASLGREPRLPQHLTLNGTRWLSGRTL